METRNSKEPATLITTSCLGYMMKRTELRQFLALYHELAETAVTKLEKDSASELYKRYIGKKQFVLEIFLTKNVDIFLQYLADILFETLMKSPDLIGLSVDIEESDSNTRDEHIRLRVEKTVRNISFSDVGKLSGFVGKTTGIDLFPDLPTNELILVLVALRNLIVHNDTAIDDLFLKRVKDIALPFELESLPGGRIQLDEKWVLESGTDVDEVVFRFDELVAKKFELPLRNRFGIFWFR